MEEYIKRKLAKLSSADFKINKYPLYYQQDTFLVKETENGEKFIIALDNNGNEVIKGVLS